MRCKKKSCKKYQKCCKKTGSCISQYHEYSPVTLPRHPFTFPTAPVYRNTQGPVVEFAPTEEYEYDEEESAPKRDHEIQVEDPGHEIEVGDPQEGYEE
uniref:Uncharacterized protein n=1 Tax=Panagrolaimus davidi TaxID=227884 RepID=A0A914PFI1_9BILA